MSFEGSFHSICMEITHTLSLRKNILLCLSQNLNFSVVLPLQSEMDEAPVIALMLFYVLKKTPKSSFLLRSQLLALSDSTRSTATSCISVGSYTSSMCMNVCFLPWFFFSPDRVTSSWSNSQHNGEHHFPLFPPVLSEPRNPVSGEGSSGTHQTPCRDPSAH